MAISNTHTHSDSDVVLKSHLFFCPSYVSISLLPVEFSHLNNDSHTCYTLDIWCTCLSFTVFICTSVLLLSFLNPADLESSQKQVEADKKAIEELIRERDMLSKVLYVLQFDPQGVFFLYSCPHQLTSVSVVKH